MSEIGGHGVVPHEIAQIFEDIFMLLAPGYSLCLVSIAFLREKEYVSIDRCTVEHLDASEIEQQFGIRFLGKKLSEVFAISGSHPFVGCDIAQMTSIL